MDPWGKAAPSSAPPAGASAWRMPQHLSNPVIRGLHRLTNLGQPSRASRVSAIGTGGVADPAEGVGQPGQAGVDVLPATFDQSVAVEDKRVAWAT
jgi:hypothetical protein